MVTFLDGPLTVGGSNTLATVSLVRGVAAFSTSTLKVGTHSISVQYADDSNFNGSTSAVLLQTVSYLAIRTTVESFPPVLSPMTAPAPNSEKSFLIAAPVAARIQSAIDRFFTYPDCWTYRLDIAPKTLETLINKSASITEEIDHVATFDSPSTDVTIRAASSQEPI
jgi:hypothetical protein